jgi:hypothetical protein
MSRQMKTSPSARSILYFSGFGATSAFTAALLYGLLYSLIGAFLTTGTVLKNMQMDVLPTIFTNALSVFIGAMFFAITFGLQAAIIQGLAFFVVAALTGKKLFGRQAILARWIGLGISLFFSLLIHLIILVSPSIVYQVFWKLSYVFWLGIPCLIFIGLTTFFSGKFQNVNP